MRRLHPAMFSAVALASALGAPGCKSKPEKICANLEAIMSKEGEKLTDKDRASCVTDIQADLDRCENAETIASCYVEATTLDAVATCESKCQKKRAKPGGSSGPSDASAAPAAPARPGGPAAPAPPGGPADPGGPAGSMD